MPTPARAKQRAKATFRKVKKGRLAFSIFSIGKSFLLGWVFEGAHYSQPPSFSTARSKHFCYDMGPAKTRFPYLPINCRGAARGTGKIIFPGSLSRFSR